MWQWTGILDIYWTGRRIRSTHRKVGDKHTYCTIKEEIINNYGKVGRFSIW